VRAQHAHRCGAEGVAPARFSRPATQRRRAAGSAAEPRAARRAQEPSLRAAPAAAGRPLPSACRACPSRPPAGRRDNAPFDWRGACVGCSFNCRTE
jgi:hypothetical protein